LPGRRLTSDARPQLAPRRVVAVLAATAIVTGALTSAAPGSASVPPTLAGRGNVAAAHSPHVLRMLAGRSAVPPFVTGAGSGRHAGASPAAVAATAMVQGIDISSRQHPGGAPIDWAKVAAAGYKFAFIKATEGSYYVNPYYSADVAAARKAGLFTAAYHFAIPNDSSGTLQADLAVDAAGATSGGRNLPLILDAEYDPYVSLDHTNACYGLTPAAMVAWIGAFTAEVQRRTGELPVIYSTSQWWDKCTASSTAFSADPLWIASGGKSPSLPAGWPQWTYWQYSSTATIPGVPVATDVSYFSTASLTPVVPATQSEPTGAAVSLPVRTLNAAAGESGLTWTATGLPGDLRINPATGAISGDLPASPVSSLVTVTVTDAATSTDSVAFTWDVHGPVGLTWPGRPAATAGSATSLQLAARDGLPGCSLTFTATGLPPGLAISPCGRITGWASRAGQYVVDIRAGDTASRTLASTSIRWTVTPAPVIAAGQVRLAIGGECLTGAAGGPAPRIRACGHFAGQRWALRQDGTIHLGSRCLAAVADASKGTIPSLRACDGRAAQSWQQAGSGGLASAATGQCLTGPGGSTSGGTALTLAVCADTSDQAWTLPPGQLAPGVPGRCVAEQPGGAGQQPAISLAPCATTAAQGWTITPAGTITAAGVCLTAASATAGAAVTLATCDAGPQQRWEAIPGRGDGPGTSPGMGAGGILIVSTAAGLCLTAPAQTATSAPALALASCVTGYPRLSWRTG
jgi:GH25 family lysozyme M1 (1,4-beta-N-acetylmuramidase)